MKLLLAILILISGAPLTAQWRPRLTPTPKQDDSRIPLPRQATVLLTSPDGHGWLQTGVIRLSFTAARRSWISLLENNGWTLTQSINLAEKERKYHELCLFQREKNKIMLMLWEDSPADTGFSWGIDQ